MPAFMPEDGMWTIEMQRAFRNETTSARRWYPAGEHFLYWNGRDAQGLAAAGTYLLTLQAEGRSFSRKVTLLK